MAAPIRFLSGRQQQQKIGVIDSTENSKVLEVVGRAGIGTTIFEPSVELDVRGSISVSGVSTLTGQVSFGNTVTFGDDDQIIMGDNNDLQIYHDGDNSYVEDTGTQALILKGSTVRFRSSDNQNMISASKNGSVDLYYMTFGQVSSKKFETTGYGVTVLGITQTQQLNVSGISTFNNDVTFTGANYNALWDKSADKLKFADNAKATFGAGDDLQIFHDGSESFIHDNGAGGLVFLTGSSPIEFRVNSTPSEKMLLATPNGAVELYHNNSKKFETTGIGVSVSNGAASTATIAAPANLIIDPAVVGDNTGLVRIKGDLFVDGTTTQINSTTLEIADFVVGIASTATSDLLTDGAGIKIGPDNTFLYEFNGGNNPSLKSSENLNVASGKVYQIDQTERLSADTLSLGTGTTIHSPASNTLTLGTNETEKVRITSDGNVGIGTDNPDTLLNLFGTGNTTIKVHNKEAAAGTYSRLQFITGGPGSSSRSEIRSLRMSSASAATNLVFFTTTAGDTSPIERLRITSAGDVGIGSTQPTAKLDVNGNIMVGVDPTIDSVSNDSGHLISSSGQILTRRDGAKAPVYSVHANAFGEIYYNYPDDIRIQFKNDGSAFFMDNVGIGTTNPTAKLDVNGNAGIGLTLTVGTNPRDGSPGLKLRGNVGHLVTRRDGAKAPVYSVYDGELFLDNIKIQFENDGSAFFMNSIGIGTTGPVTKLHVHDGAARVTNADKTNHVELGPDGNIEIRRAGGGGYIDFADNPSDDFDARIQNYDSGLQFFTGVHGSGTNPPQTRFVVDSIGNVGIGTTIPNSAKLDVKGTIRHTGVTTMVPGAFDVNSVVGERPLQVNYKLLSTSLRTGFLVKNAFDFRTDNTFNSAFMVLDPYDTSNSTFAFRVAVGATLSDTAWIKTDGDGYFSGNIGIGTSIPSAKLTINPLTTLPVDGTESPTNNRQKANGGVSIANSENKIYPSSNFNATLGLYQENEIGGITTYASGNEFIYGSRNVLVKRNDNTQDIKALNFTGSETKVIWTDQNTAQQIIADRSTIEYLGADANGRTSSYLIADNVFLRPADGATQTINNVVSDNGVFIQPQAGINTVNITNLLGVRPSIPYVFNLNSGTHDVNITDLVIYDTGSDWGVIGSAGTVTVDIDNYYGLRLLAPTDNASDLTFNNNFGVYSGWSESKNYFAGNVGIGTDNPTAKLAINPLTTLSTSGDIGGVSIANTENKTYPTTSGFNVTLGLDQDIEVGGTQVIDPSTPGGFNYISGIRNFLRKQNNNTQDIERSSYYGIEQRFDWNDRNTCKQYTSIFDSFVYAGIDTNGRTSSTFDVDRIVLLPPEGGQQTVASVTSKNVALRGNGATGISTVAITDATGYSPSLTFQNFATGTHNNSITNYSAFGTNLWGTQGSTGTLNATITNYYGLRLSAPISSTGLTITNNYGVYSGWSESKNYFAGNVGIGTDDPKTKLHVESGTGTETRVTISQQKSYGAGTGTTERAGLDLAIREASHTADNRTFARIETGPEAETSSSASFLSFSTRTEGNIGEKLRITSDGHVGIGTDNPDSVVSNANSSILHVGIITARKIFGDANITGTIDSARNVEINDDTTNSGTHYIHFGNETAGNDQVEVDSNGLVYKDGKVGIGTDNPTYSLDLGKTPSTIRLVSQNNGTAIRVGAGGPGNDVTLIRVDGHIPTNIFGESNDSSYGFSLKYIGSRSDNNNSLSVFSDNQEGTQVEAITVFQDGKVGINSTVPTEKLDVIGTVKATDFNTTSDQNLKTNVRTIENSIEKITEIRGVNFEWKDNNKPSAGVIAQEVEKVFPELIGGEETKTVNYNGLIGLLIEVVKEQQTQINSLNQRLSKLE